MNIEHVNTINDVNGLFERGDLMAVRPHLGDRTLDIVLCFGDFDHMFVARISEDTVVDAFNAAINAYNATEAGEPQI